MDFFIQWLLPIGLMAFIVWQLTQLPKGGRRTYYFVLLVILLAAFLLKTVFRVI